MQIPVSTVIDVGASDGRWSKEAMRYYPDAAYHLIEANEVHLMGLESFVRRHAGSSFTLAAAANRVGEIAFDGSDPWGGVAAHDPGEGSRSKVPCTTIDEEVSRLSLHGPFLVKLDTHGFEVPILEGASQTLLDTAVIVMETYNFNLTAESLMFWEMCDYLSRKGFRPFDLLEPLHRPGDGAFWQVDIVFIREDRAEFRNNRYA